MTDNITRESFLGEVQRLYTKIAQGKKEDFEEICGENGHLALYIVPFRSSWMQTLYPVAGILMLTTNNEDAVGKAVDYVCRGLTSIMPLKQNTDISERGNADGTKLAYEHLARYLGLAETSLVQQGL